MQKIVRELYWLYLDIKNYLNHLYWLHFNLHNEKGILDWIWFLTVLKERNWFQSLLIKDLLKRYSRKYATKSERD